MWERILVIVRKELLQTVRDIRRRMLLFGPPLLQLIVFGYAVNMDVQNVRMAWLIWTILLKAASSGHPLNHQILPGGRDSLPNRRRPGSARPRGDSGHRQILPRSGAMCGGALRPRSRSWSTARIPTPPRSYRTTRRRSLHRTRLPRWPNLKTPNAGFRNHGGLPGPSAGLSAQLRVWFNPDLKSRDYFVPGVVVNIIALVTIMLTSMSIVREKEVGTMEQLMVTPDTALRADARQVLPFALIGLFEVALVRHSGRIGLSDAFPRKRVDAVHCSVLFLLTTLASASLSRPFEHDAAGDDGFFLFLSPAMLLSGFAFPVRNMPPVVQYLTYLNPVRYFMEIVRGIFLKGTGPEFLWPQMTALFVIGAAILILSSLRFHKRLD